MVVGLLFLTLAGVVLLSVGIVALLDKLPPNSWAGIRTPFTRSSPENWYRTHRAAAPLLIFGGVAMLSIGLAFLPFALAGKIGDGLQAAVVIALAAVLLLTAIGSWLFGTSRARAAG